MQLFGKRIGRKYGVLLSLAETDEGDRLHAAIIEAWHTNEAERLCELLSEADKQYFYSNYPWWHAWEFEQQAQIVQFLLRSLPFEQFLRLSFQKTLSKFEILKGLNELSDELSDAQIRQLAEAFGFPYFNGSPQLFERIVASPDAAMTAWLHSWIDERTSAEKKSGRKLSTHQKTISTFHFQWSPDDKDLSVAVGALAQRTDDESRELTRSYLLTLPWGRDRNATERLLSGLMKRDDDTVLPIIEAALNVQTELTASRLLLSNCLIKLAPGRALQMFLSDCARLDDPIAIEAYLGWWQSHHEELQPFAPSTRALAASLNLDAWPMLLRGQAANLWYRAWPSPPRGSALNRALQILIRAFEACRVEHMGCGIVLPLCMLLGYGWLALLRYFLGPTKAGWKPFIVGCLIAWIFALAITSHTHFSGHEKLKEKLWLSLIFFGSLLLFLGFSLAAHL